MIMRRYVVVAATSLVLLVILTSVVVLRQPVNEDKALPLPMYTQRDATLVYYWDGYLMSPEGSIRKIEARKKLVCELLLGIKSDDNSQKRLAGQPLVDDRDCYMPLETTFETHCGPLPEYMQS